MYKGPTMTQSTEDVSFRYAERVLTHHLISSVKQHLLAAIDKELDQICQDVVRQHIEVTLAKDYSASSLSTNYYYQFVQKIVNNVVKETVVIQKEQQ